jgi:hypothetical protein
MDQTVGTCSLCGGRVTVPFAWMGVIPPTPKCASCGAHAASHGPVIPMVAPVRATPVVPAPSWFIDWVDRQHWTTTSGSD